MCFFYWQNFIGIKKWFYFTDNLMFSTSQCSITVFIFGIDVSVAESKFFDNTAFRFLQVDRKKKQFIVGNFHIGQFLSRWFNEL